MSGLGNPAKSGTASHDPHDPHDGLVPELEVAREEPVAIDLTMFMPLVRSIACRIHASIPSYAGVELGDLLQAGHLGLVHAGRAYCSSKRVPFAVFARFRIRGEILDSLRQVDSVSRNMRRWDKRIRSTEQELAGELSREPTDAEVGAKLQIDLGSLQIKRQALNAGRLSRVSTTAMDENAAANAGPVTDRNPELLHAESEARELLDRAIRKLPLRSREVIRLYYIQGITMRQIGSHFSVNESRISQIHRSALERMARHLKASGVSSSKEI